jgi:uncharacterized protein (TIGR02421 family)
MIQPKTPPPAEDDLARVVLARLAEDRRVRRTLPAGGTLHFDRRLPFLCVYRYPPGGSDWGDEHLITAETAYLIAPGETRLFRAVAEVTHTIIEAMISHFGSFLVIEFWPSPDSVPTSELHEESGEPLPVAPGFTIHVPKGGFPRRTVDTLVKSMGTIKIHRRLAEVTVQEHWNGRPPGFRALLTPAEAKRIGCFVVGLEVRPIYRDPETRELFPAVMQQLRRQVTRSTKRAFFTFVRNHTNLRPQHYLTLGRRTVVKSVWEVDRMLAEVGSSFDFLLQATPINAEAAWHEFRRSHYEKAPVFLYRPLAVEPAILKRRLYDIPIEKVEDPTIAHLFRQKQDELDRKITMLADIGTRRFFLGGLQIYGSATDSLQQLAHELLCRIPPRSREDSSAGHVNAAEFADMARAEVEYYRSQYAEFGTTVTIRDDIYTGLLTSQGNLLIGNKTRIPVSRVEALLHHEIGTHAVTYFNGRAQPFRQLYIGLAGYDALQEGLAVLSEYLVDGLSRPRMRLLAARVFAARRLVDGASFVDTFRALTNEHAFPQRRAYTITMRIYRGGGLTKDVVYLQGLTQILEYLREGGEIEPLLVGKIAADHIPLIDELQHRHVLRPPPLRPRYLDLPAIDERISRVRQGLKVTDLLERMSVPQASRHHR